MRTLLLDIETAPNVVHVWGLRDQDIATNQLIEVSYVMCWAAKWLDEPGVLFERTHRKMDSSIGMIRKIHRLMEKADHIITHNGNKFDLPTLNKEFLLKGLYPLPPVHYTDTLTAVKSRFRFVSNRLDHLAQELGVGKKVSHEGHTLWVKCMNDDPKAWADMERYNKNDVVILEGVYNKIKPWIKTQASFAARNGDRLVCPKCGGKNYQQRGFMYTKVAKYARFACTDCRSWFRLNVNELERGAMKMVSV